MPITNGGRAAHGTAQYAQHTCGTCLCSSRSSGWITQHASNKRFHSSTDVSMQFDDNSLWLLTCRYSHAIAVFVWFQRGEGRSVENVQLKDSLSDLSSDERAQASRHLAACFVNAAAVLGKQGQQSGVVYACTKALEHDPENAKALFRRAQVQSPYTFQQAVQWVSPTSADSDDWHQWEMKPGIRRTGTVLISYRCNWFLPVERGLVHLVGACCLKPPVLHCLA